MYGRNGKTGIYGNFYHGHPLGEKFLEKGIRLIDRLIR